MRKEKDIQISRRTRRVRRSTHNTRGSNVPENIFLPWKNQRCLLYFFQSQVVRGGQNDLIPWKQYGDRKSAFDADGVGMFTIQGGVPMKRLDPAIIDYYDQEVVKMIAEKYGYSPMDALRQFVFS